MRIGEDRIGGRRWRRSARSRRRPTPVACARAGGAGADGARDERRFTCSSSRLSACSRSGSPERLDVRLERAQRAVEPEIVLIERPQTPRQRRLERRHHDVEEDAVALEPEAARVRVVADEQIRQAPARAPADDRA